MLKSGELRLQRSPSMQRHNKKPDFKNWCLEPSATDTPLLLTMNGPQQIFLNVPFQSSLLSWPFQGQLLHIWLSSNDTLNILFPSLHLPLFFSSLPADLRRGRRESGGTYFMTSPDWKFSSAAAQGFPVEVQLPISDFYFILFFTLALLFQIDQIYHSGLWDG